MEKKSAQLNVLNDVLPMINYPLWEKERPAIRNKDLLKWEGPYWRWGEAPHTELLSGSSVLLSALVLKKWFRHPSHTQSSINRANARLLCALGKANYLYTQAPKVANFNSSLGK